MGRTLHSLFFLPADVPIRVGVSSCLLGQSVRWDGRHRLDAYVAGTLAQVFELVPVCPEVAIGLGVPRPPIRLVSQDKALRAVGVHSPHLDVTDRLAKYGKTMARELDDVCGYILKSDSPSCGMERVQVYRGAAGPPARTGAGVYAQAFMQARPGLPMEEEGSLKDSASRENFVERVFAYRRWQTLRRIGFSRARLAAFHAAHSLSLMAHGTDPGRALGRWIGQGRRRPLEMLAEGYLREFMAALKRPATRKLHARVLAHLAGCLKPALDAQEREVLARSIAQYRLGRIPLDVPITLLQHHFRRRPHPAVAGQVYLEAHPAKLHVSLSRSGRSGRRT